MGMQNSAVRSKSETITMFVNTNNSASQQCAVYKILDDNTFSPVPYTPDIIEIETELYSTVITLPNEDCTLCVLFKGRPIVIRVGNPTAKFIYYRIVAGLDVPYNHFYPDGVAISDGLLNEAGAGFYFRDVHDFPSSIIVVDRKHFRIKLPYGLSSSETSGTILIQNNVWQLIAIPKENVNVKEYFVDRLSLKYSVPAKDMVEICTAYFGNENKFRSYIPGVTNPATANNFPLVFADGTSREISGFWVKIKDLTGLVPDVNGVKFDWSST